MVAVSLGLVLIFTILSLSLNVLLFIVVVGRTTTVIKQINDFDGAVATLFTRLNDVLERFETGGGQMEPVNPIQMILAQYLGKQMEKNDTINNRNELGQFKTVEKVE